MGDLKGLYIDPELHKKIKALAAAEGVPLREMVERLLREELGNDDDKGQPAATDGDQRRR